MNLATRGLGQAPALQPRLPSLFEPLPAILHAPVIDPPLAPQDRRPVATPASTPAVERQLQQSPAPSLAPSPAKVLVLASGERIAPISSRKEPPSLAPPPNAAAAAVAGRRDQGPRPAASSSPPRIGELAPPLPHHAPIARLPTPAQAAAVIRPRVTAIVAPAAPVQLADETEPRAAEPTSPPSIQVRIGRVEVRAVLPPASNVRRPAELSKPALSLEEYLKQRSARRR
jgi:hypothetical protein